MSLEQSDVHSRGPGHLFKLTQKETQSERWTGERGGRGAGGD